MDVERPAIHVEAMWGFCLGGDGGHELMSIYIFTEGNYSFLQLLGCLL